MPNKISDSKKQISLVLEKKLLAMLDAECERTGRNRTETIVTAIREHLKLDPVPASAAQIDEIKTAMVALVQEQKALQEVVRSNETPLLEDGGFKYRKTILGLYRRVK